MELPVGPKVEKSRRKFIVGDQLLSFRSTAVPGRRSKCQVSPPTAGAWPSAGQENGLRSCKRRLRRSARSYLVTGWRNGNLSELTYRVPLGILDLLDEGILTADYD
jgi:hypothetical protein